MTLFIDTSSDQRELLYQVKFAKKEVYPDAAGRLWTVHDIVHDVMLVSQEDCGHCLAVIDDEARATVRLPDGFTTLYAEGERWSSPNPARSADPMTSVSSCHVPRSDVTDAG